MEFNSDLSNLTDTERASLESGFRDTYNSLTAALCDEPYHRYIADVTLEWPPKRRRRLRDLQEGESPTTNNQEKSLIDFSFYLPQNATQQQQPIADGLTSNTQQQSTETEGPPPDEYIVTDVARFLVKVACHDCPTNSTLFFEPPLVDNGDATVTAMIPTLSTLTTIAKGRSREANFGAWGLDGSACGCVKHDVPIDDSTLLQQQQPFRAPTSLEFQLAYNQTVGSLNVDGILQGDLDQVEELVEVDVVNCSSNVQRFSSSVVANLQGDAANMSPEERMALERGFLETYNSLTFARCDRFFRQIVEVKLISAQDRRPEDSQRRNMLLEDDFDSLYNDDDDTVSDMGYGTDTFDDIEFYSNGTYYGNGTNALWYNTSFTAAPTSGVVPAVYRVLGECRDCAVSESGGFNLFDDVMVRRTLSEMQRHHRQVDNDYHKTSWLPADTMTSPFQPPAFNNGGLQDRHGRALLEPANVCLCPANTEQVDPTAPTDEEFQEEYSLTVEILQEEGIVTSVDKVEDVANDEDACEEAFLEVTGVYVITFRDELKGQVSKDDNLEDAFRAAYRSFGRGVCGPFLSEVGVIEIIEEKDEDVYQVVYSVGSLQTLRGKIFYEVEVPLLEKDEAKTKQRKEEDDDDELDIETEEEKFIEAFNQYLGGNRLSAEAMFIRYASTLAPTWAPTTEDMRTNMPVPAGTVAPTNDNTNSTTSDRQGDKETQKTSTPSASDGTDDNSPTVTPGKEAIELTKAPMGSKVPTIAPLPTLPTLPTLPAFPTLPTTAAPSIAPVVAPTIPIVSAPTVTPVSSPPVTTAPTVSPTKAPTLRPTVNPTATNENGDIAPRPTATPPSPSPTLKPTNKIGKVVDDADDFVAEIVEDISDTIETIVGHIVPILDDAKEFFENVESALEDLGVTGLPDIPDISDLLEHIDDRVNELADLSIPGLPETTKRIHETIQGFLSFLRPSKPAPAPSLRPTRAPTVAPTQVPTPVPTPAPTLSPDNKDGDEDKDTGKDKDKDKDKDDSKDKDSEEEISDEEDSGNGGRQGISTGDSNRTPWWARIWEWALPSPTPVADPATPSPTSAPISVPPSIVPVFTPTTDFPSPAPVETNRPTLVPSEEVITPGPTTIDDEIGDEFMTLKPITTKVPTEVPTPSMSEATTNQVVTALPTTSTSHATNAPTGERSGSNLTPSPTYASTVLPTTTASSITTTPSQSKIYDDETTVSPSSATSDVAATISPTPITSSLNTNVPSSSATNNEERNPDPTYATTEQLDTASPSLVSPSLTLVPSTGSTKNEKVNTNSPTIDSSSFLTAIPPAPSVGLPNEVTSSPTYATSAQPDTLSPSLAISSVTASPTVAGTTLKTHSPSTGSTQRFVTSESPTAAHTSTPASGAFVTSSPSVASTTGMPTTTMTGSPTALVPALEGALTASPTTSEPRKIPTLSPTLPPTSIQTTEQTSVAPTNPPSREPSAAPTIAPTVEPTEAPTSAPTTREPSAAPTPEPTTSEPTRVPTVSPTSKPSAAPSLEPTHTPTVSPTSEPTSAPTQQPTTSEPTNAPTDEPTAEPTGEPT